MTYLGDALRIEPDIFICLPVGLSLSKVVSKDTSIDDGMGYLQRKRDEDALAADEARQSKLSAPSPPIKLGSLRDGFKPSLRVGRSR